MAYWCKHTGQKSTALPFCMRSNVRRTLRIYRCGHTPSHGRRDACPSARTTHTRHGPDTDTTHTYNYADTDRLQQINTAAPPYITLFRSASGRYRVAVHLVSSTLSLTARHIASFRKDTILLLIRWYAAF